MLLYCHFVVQAIDFNTGVLLSILIRIHLPSGFAVRAGHPSDNRHSRFKFILGRAAILSSQGAFLAAQAGIW